MHDGVRLATDIYFPESEEPHPCILMRTPYSRRGRVQEEAAAFAEQGFAVALQDVRGKFDSEGAFNVSAADGRDGDSTVTWLAAQGWCSGKIGTYGCSYLGEAQMQLATFRNPHHAAMIAKASGGANSQFGFIDGGGRGLEWGLKWFIQNGNRLAFTPSDELDMDELIRGLPTIDLVTRAGAPPSEWEEFIAREPADPWWDTRGYLRPDDRFDVPTLMVESWYDAAIAPALRAHEQIRDRSETERSRDGQYLIVSPTTHCNSERATARTVVGDRDLGDARFDHHGLYVRWFDYWLKGQGGSLEDLPKVHYYVMGANAWRTAPRWPPTAEQTVLYLHSHGRANSRSGDGFLSLDPPADEAPDRFPYDPADPVPSLGGQMFATSDDPAAGARDQAPVEERDDVLVYTSPPLRSGVEITGYVSVELFISSDAVDTDFTAKLIDVAPDGRAYNLQQGLTRARYRRGYEEISWLEPGKVVRVPIDLHATSNFFDAGHRIRLQVASSDFPLYDRNLNTGENNALGTRWRIATNSVHHDREFMSAISLPVASGEMAFSAID